MKRFKIKTCLPFLHRYGRAYGQPLTSGLYKSCSICGYTKRA